MRASLFAIASCMALLMPIATQAQNVAPAQAVSQAADQPSRKLICRYSYYEGSVIRRPQCRTQAEWDRIRYESQKEVSDFQMRSLTVNIR